MNETNGRYKKASRKTKTAPVRRITVSEETARAYEKIVKERDDREREYGRHLSQDKPSK